MSDKRPLAGFRVLEIASMIFGPLAGQYLVANEFSFVKYREDFEAAIGVPTAAGGACAAEQ